MKKILIILFTFFLCIFVPCKVIYGAEPVQVLDQKYYTEDGKIKIYSTWFPDNKYCPTIGIEFLDTHIPEQTFYGADGTIVTGTITYPNRSEIQVGYFELQWVFTPDKSNIYETKKGVFTFNFLKLNDGWEYPSEESEIASRTEDGLISLTTNTLFISNNSSYDININNKTKGSTYYWESSNPKIAKVDKKSGIVTAIKDGNAKITCTITLPDKTQTQLYTDVTVGLDEDAPILSETDLTLDVGDKFDIDVENKISKSKYSFKSDDKTVAKVNSLNGIVTALKQGSCNITCTIITPDKSIYILKATVTVE